MCLAPRYINGAMARPSRPSRKIASLPETPWASAVAAAITAAPSAMATVNAVRLVAEIFGMALGAGVVERFSHLENLFGALGIRGGNGLPAGVGHRPRDARPILAIYQAIALEQEVG